MRKPHSRTSCVAGHPPGRISGKGRIRPITECRTNGSFPASHAPDLPFCFRPDRAEGRTSACGGCRPKADGPKSPQAVIPHPRPSYDRFHATDCGFPELPSLRARPIRRRLRNCRVEVMIFESEARISSFHRRAESRRDLRRHNSAPNAWFTLTEVA